MDPDAFRGRVAEAAVVRFRQHGYECTTLADIAHAAATTETEVQGLFGDKEGLMAELVSPLMNRLMEVEAAAATTDVRQPQQLRDVLGEYLDALMAHRLLVGLISGEPTSASSEAVRHFRAALRRLRDELAGSTGADLDHTIRASAALGAVQAAVLELTDIDPVVVRDVITDAAVAIILS